jgi:hypothetical protein
MGNTMKLPAFVPPAPPKCSKETTEVSTWKSNLDNTRKIYEEKRLAADQCSPEEAARRAAAGQGPSECVANDVALNTAIRDVAAKDAKWQTCYPDQAVNRSLAAAKKEAAEYGQRSRTAQNAANGDYKVKYAAMQKLKNSAQELYKTLFEKEKELATLTDSRQSTEQLERRERRAFLDNDPQGGAGGAPGIRTLDDRVLFAFWITYGAAIIAGAIFLLNVYGAQINATDLKSKATITAIAAASAYGIAYYFISFYG